MDHLQTRLEALEQRTHTVEQQLRWWRGLAGGLLVLAVLTWALPSGMAQEEDAKERGQKGLAQRVAALEQLLKHFSREDNEVFITGANLRIVNGLGQTDCGTEEEPIPDCPNGLGNLIVSYNELRDQFNCGSGPFCINMRTGSHNVVVGQHHNFSSVGGLVVGDFNTISGAFASVSGGSVNTASGTLAVVSGGSFNEASGGESVVSGGSVNTASGAAAAISGGRFNTASGAFTSATGGSENTASEEGAAVSGGKNNQASGINSSVSGGSFNTASGAFASVGGGGDFFSEGGNTASGTLAVVSGGFTRIAAGQFDWVAGNLFEED